MKYSTIPLFILLCFLLSSCHVALIGDYDAIADQSVAKIQTEVSALIIQIEKNIQNKTPANNNYANLENEYTTIEADIKALQLRCYALPKYGIIGSQVSKLSDNIQLLEEFNQTPPGFTTMGPITLIDSTLEVQFAAITALQNGLKRQKN